MSENSSQSEVKPRRRLGVVILVLLLLLVLVLAGLAGWYGWRQLRSLHQSTDAYAQRLSVLQSRLEELHSTYQQQVEQLNERIEELSSVVEARSEKLEALRSGNHTVWMLKQAASLASLAQQRLLLNADRAAAERLLEAADRVLSHINHPSVMKARKALARDLAKVRGSRQVDITSLVLRLGALRELISKVAVPAGTRAGSDAKGASENGGRNDAQSWWEHLPLTLTRHDHPVPLPLTGAQASLVRLQLYNGLQMAQLALLQSRPRVYREAIESMLTVVQAWLPTDEPRVQQLLTALRDLRDAPVKQALPNIGAGLKAIRELLREYGGRS